MRTGYRIIQVDGTETRAEVDWPRDPGLERITGLVRPIVGCQHVERVAVLDGDKAVDMFVDENGRASFLPREQWKPRNETATRIYRAHWLKHHPGTDPETLSWIAGVAVIFARRVWF